MPPHRSTANDPPTPQPAGQPTGLRTVTLTIPDTHLRAWQQLKANLGADSDDAALTALLESHPVAGSRFMPLPEVADILATSQAQVYALVRSGELPAIKIGGRGQWRVERARFEAWIAGRYAHAEESIDAPLDGSS